MQEKQIVINNLLVNYYVAGREDAASAVVFLHGWRSEGRVWDGAVGGLLRSARNDGKDYNIYALDLPGFGKSEAPKRAFTVGDYAEIVEEFIEKVVGKSTPSQSPPIRPLQAERTGGETAVVGHSFGGRVAIKLAATRPDLVHKLVLVDSAGIRVEPPAKLLKNTVAKILKPLFNFGFMQPLRAKLYRVMGAEDYVATPGLRQTFLNTVNEDLTVLLSKINIPTLLVWGERDKEVPLELGRKMSFPIPNSQFLILKNAGHFSFVDKSEEFVKYLVEFLR